MKQLLFVFTILALLGSCKRVCDVRYGKILKSKSIQEKYDYALCYYEHEDYYRALPLLDELIGLVRGTALYEDVYYYYTKTNYYIGDYYISNYYAKQFSKTFSNSSRAEELNFLSAMSSYHNSPSFSLDQSSTSEALGQFQFFLDSYPNSQLKDSCENMMLRLNYKLEKKAVEIAKLYVQTEKFKSGTIAIDNVLTDYPDSQFREELFFLRVKTWYNYAINSIESKKTERFNECIKSYTTFAAAFPESEFLSEAESLYKKANAQIN